DPATRRHARQGRKRGHRRYSCQIRRHRVASADRLRRRRPQAGSLGAVRVVFGFAQVRGSPSEPFPPPRSPLQNTLSTPSPSSPLVDGRRSSSDARALPSSPLVDGTAAAISSPPCPASADRARAAREEKGDIVEWPAVRL